MMTTKLRAILAAAAATLTAIAGLLLALSGPAPAPIPVPVVGGPFAPRATGWVPDAKAVESFRTRHAVPEFTDTEAGREVSRAAGDVYLWEACRRVTGDVLPARNQGQVGCCVGFGTTAAIEHLMCVELAAESEPGRSFKPVAPEAVYAGSRVQVGGGRIRGDGSVGAWAAEFVRSYGVVPRGKYASVDLSRYDENTCRRLGSAGLSSELVALARENPVKGVARVGRFAEAQKAIENGYPVAVCSSQGFAMTRDRNGFCAPRGTWYHCMALVGVRGGPRPGGFLLNSWGPDAHTGPRDPADAPVAGFWADAGVLDRMLAEGDSWAFSGFDGFKARKLDWYAARPEVRPVAKTTP